MYNNYIFKWILTIFTRSFPFHFVVRVWDAFLNEGWKVIYRVCLALFKVNKSIFIYNKKNY